MNWWVWWPHGDLDATRAWLPFVDGLLLAVESATSDAAAIDLQSDYGQGGYAPVSWAGLIMEMHGREANIFCMFQTGPSRHKFGCVELSFSVWMQPGGIHHVALSLGVTLRLGKGCSQILRRRPARKIEAPLRVESNETQFLCKKSTWMVFVLSVHQSWSLLHLLSFNCQLL